MRNEYNYEEWENQNEHKFLSIRWKPEKFTEWGGERGRPTDESAPRVWKNNNNTNKKQLNYLSTYPFTAIRHSIYLTLFFASFFSVIFGWRRQKLGKTSKENELGWV